MGDLWIPYLASHTSKTGTKNLTEQNAQTLSKS